MPRRQGQSIAPVGEVWTRDEDGEWVAVGSAKIKGRATWHTRRRRHRIGTKIKESNKAKKRSN